MEKGLKFKLTEHARDNVTNTWIGNEEVEVLEIYPTTILVKVLRTGTECYIYHYEAYLSLRGKYVATLERMKENINQLSKLLGNPFKRRTK